MKNNFIMDMKRKYYLDYNDEHFNNVISKKTNIPESVIEELKKRFNQAEKTNYADDEDLNNIYFLIEKFHNTENE
jgi:rRNA-processing protein FCF1